MFPVSHFSQVLNGESAFGSTETCKYLDFFRKFQHSESAPKNLQGTVFKRIYGFTFLS